MSTEKTEIIKNDKVLPGMITSNDKVRRLTAGGGIIFDNEKTAILTLNLKTGKGYLESAKKIRQNYFPEINKKKCNNSG